MNQRYLKSAIYPSQCNVEKTTEMDCILWPVPAFGWAPVKNVSKSSNVYQILRAPFHRKTVVFANGERITEVNEFRMAKKYPLRSSCKVLSLRNKMVYKSFNHKINNIARKLAGKYSDSFANMFNCSNCTIEAHCLPLIEALELLLTETIFWPPYLQFFSLQTTTLVPRLPGLKVPSNQPPSTL